MSGTDTGGECAFAMYRDGTVPEDADLTAPNAKQTTPDSSDASSESHNESETAS